MSVKNESGGIALRSLMVLALIVPGQVCAQASLERVEITGSGLRRPQGENPVPITVIRAEDLSRMGMTQIEQAIGWMASNQSSLGIANSVGFSNGGKAEADLRGLSSPFGGNADKTLVLLNGRRLVNHPIDGSALDLYALPLSAVDRIEVLRDGASALYGSDAIGGVVNVILRHEQRRTDVSLEAQGAQHGGGATRRFSLSTGLGSLDENDFQATAFIDLRRQNRLAAVDRPFSRTGVLQGDVFGYTSRSSFPGDINGFEPSFPDCAAPSSLATPAGTCRYDYVRDTDAIPANEQRTAFLKSDVKLSPDATLSAEYLWSRHQAVSSIAPSIGYHCMRAGTPDAPSPFFPAGATPVNLLEACGVDELGGLVDWREVPAGRRKRANTTISDRALVEVQGSIDAGWDFRSGLGRSTSRSNEKLLSGFANEELMQQGVWNGVINPFGAQTAQGQAFIDAAQVVGPVQAGRSRSDFADLRVRGELVQLDTGPLALAMGIEHRRDRSSVAFSEVTALVPSLGLDPAGDTAGSRQVTGFYSEVSWPVTKALELTAASRIDQYSDVGSTFNPKLGFSLRAAGNLLLRGSLGTGFRAPSLYDVHRPQTLGYTIGFYNDPLYCANGAAGGGVNAESVCDRSFNIRNTGPQANGQPADSLRPEKSRNLTLGFVVEPAKSLSIGLDYWNIAVRNLIGEVPEQAVFQDPAKYASRIVRCSQLTGSGGTSVGRDQIADCQNTAIDPIAYIDLPTENLGRLKTSGLDFSAAWRALANEQGQVGVGFNATYVHAYRYQREAGGASIDAVGRYSDNAPIFRWQHSLSVNWTVGAWSLTVAQRYKSGYVDQEPIRRVSSYALHDAMLQWSGIRDLTLSVGVRNLFDRDPPFSLQYSTFQAGYDPRFADPLGRVLALRAAYRF